MQYEFPVNKDCNPGQLEGEIKVIQGMPQRGLSVYLTTGKHGIVIFSGELSQALQDAIVSKINAHVPDFTAENEATEAQALYDKGVLAYRNWSSLTNNQKDTVLKELLRLALLKLK